MYLPDLPRPAYQDLLDSLEQELTYTFGGCSVVRGLEGNFLSRLGAVVRDRVNLLFTDVDVAFDDHFSQISRYTDHVREAAFDALDEEVVLVVAFKVYHSE